MSWNLGATVSLTTTVTDDAGVPADAGTMAISITLPDGTTDGGPVTSSSPGVYCYDYATTQPGRHVYRWIATGQNSSGYPAGDMFEVLPADPGQLVSLAEAKEQLNITGSQDDAEIMRKMQAVTGPVERIVGAVGRRAWTETYDGGTPRIALLHFPVLAVTQVVESGTVLASSAYTLKPTAGVLTRLAGGVASRWRPGDVTVLYEAGRIITGEHIRQAVLIILQHLWETQRGGFSASPRDSDTYDPRFGYSIPRRALELLGEPIPGFA
ncbi:head-tail connector protein [Actinoallomurus iriomotensis]|uniref:Uncharacterized protein n=1 Tax=Actinoallomurus iriomotensis TaxID=478107 RepID=A0A9W6RU11_9ACTN|nr:head-tail connector protein [Actinoallomurus iriomotensis]GLY81841.1 hypothetical protein Airi01_101080 [Actinoallomurus iriomotensis]